MKALVVDRDRRRARGLAATLARRGFDADVAHSARGALTLLRAMPDVGVLYVTQRLSTWSGPDLLAAVERSGRRRAPVYVVGVDTESSVLARALRAGGAATVVSSRPVDELATAITHAALERTRVRDATAREHARLLRSHSRANILRARGLVATARALVARRPS